MYRNFTTFIVSSVRGGHHPREDRGQVDALQRRPPRRVPQRQQLLARVPAARAPPLRRRRRLPSPPPGPGPLSAALSALRAGDPLAAAASSRCSSLRSAAARSESSRPASRAESSAVIRSSRAGLPPRVRGASAPRTRSREATSRSPKGPAASGGFRHASCEMAQFSNRSDGRPLATSWNERRTAEYATTGLRSPDRPAVYAWHASAQTPASGLAASRAPSSSRRRYRPSRTASQAFARAARSGLTGTWAKAARSSAAPSPTCSSTVPKEAAAGSGPALTRLSTAGSPTRNRRSSSAGSMPGAATSSASQTSAIVSSRPRRRRRSAKADTNSAWGEPVPRRTPPPAFPPAATPSKARQAAGT